MSNTQDKIAIESLRMVNADPFAPVRLTSIMHDGRPTDKVFVEIQCPEVDRWDVPAGTQVVHSLGYQLIPNAQARELAMRTMARTGMSFVPTPHHSDTSTSVTWTGRTYVERWYTPDMKVATPQGSEVMLGVEVRNSYDKSSKLKLSFFGMHCACQNQFFSNNLLGAPLSLSHVMGQNKDGESFDEALELAFDSLVDRAENFGAMTAHIGRLNAARFNSLDDYMLLMDECRNETKLTLDDTKILRELKHHTSTKDIGLDVGDAYGDPNSYWALANAFTALCTHATPGVGGAERSARFVDFLIDRA